MPDLKSSSPDNKQVLDGMTEALQRIENTRLEKSVRLDWSGLALTTVSESLGNLTGAMFSQPSAPPARAGVGDLR